MNVELHIERLVLNGLPLPPGGRAALAGALGRELTLLIQAGGVSPALLGGTGLPRLTATLAPSALISAPARSAGNTAPAAGSRLGREIARSVYSCLGRS
jgi:hypothetical protein